MITTTLGNGSIVRHTDPSETLTFESSDPTAPEGHYSAGMLLRVATMRGTFYLCRDTRGGGDPFTFQRAGVLTAGPHPDSGRVFTEVHFGQRIEVDGRTFEFYRAPNNNLGLATVETLS